MPFTFLWTRPDQRAAIMLAMRELDIDLETVYPSSLNWCNRMVERLGDVGGAASLTGDEGPCFSILRQNPLPSARFVELMEMFCKASVANYLLTGLVDARIGHHSKSIDPSRSMPELITCAAIQDIQWAEGELHRRVQLLVAKREQMSMTLSSSSAPLALTKSNDRRKERRARQTALKQAVGLRTQSVPDVTQAPQVPNLPGFDMAELTADLPSLSALTEKEKTERVGGFALHEELAFRSKPHQ